MYLNDEFFKALAEFRKYVKDNPKVETYLSSLRDTIPIWNSHAPAQSKFFNRDVLSCAHLILTTRRGGIWWPMINSYDGKFPEPTPYQKSVWPVVSVLESTEKAGGGLITYIKGGKCPKPSADDPLNLSALLQYFGFQAVEGRNTHPGHGGTPVHILIGATLEATLHYRDRNGIKFPKT